MTTKEAEAEFAQKLREILDDIDDDLWQLQITAAEAIGEIGIEKNENILSLKNALYRLYPGMENDVAASAVNSIVTIANSEKLPGLVDTETQKYAVNMLVEALKNKHLRSKAKLIIHGLGEMKSPSSIENLIIEPLLEVVSDKEYDIESRAEAIKSIAEITRASKKTPKV